MGLSEEELKHLAHLASGSAVFVALCKVEGEHLVGLYPSHSLHTIFGMESGEFEETFTRDVSDLVVPDDLPSVMGSIQECLRTSGQISHEWRIRHTKQSSIKVRCTIEYCGDYDDRPVVLIVFDTGRGDTDSYKEILDHIPVGVCVLFMPDRDHQELEFVNKQMMRLISPDEMAPELMDPSIDPVRSAYYRNAFSGVHPDDLPAVMDTFHRYFELQRFSLAPFRLRTASGRYIWISLDVALHEVRPDGRVFYGAYRDVTPEVELRRELDEQRQRSMEQAMVNTIGSLPACSVLYRIREDGVASPERYSDEFCRLVGCTQETISSLVNEKGYIPVYEADREMVKESVLGSRADGEMHRAVFRTITMDGAYRWVDASYVYFSFGDCDYLYVIYTDIDDLKRREQRLGEQYQSAQAYLDSVSKTYLMTGRLNLTQNRVEAIGGTKPLPHVEEATDYESLIGITLKAMPREQDRRECAHLFSREYLMNAFEDGEKTISCEFEVRTSDDEMTWVKTLVILSKRTSTGDIIAFDAMSDIGQERCLNQIINRIVTSHFDFIALLDIHTGMLECIKKNADVEFFEPGKKVPYESACAFVRSSYLHDDQAEHFDTVSSLDRVIAGMHENGRYVISYQRTEGGKLACKQTDFTWLDEEGGLILMIRSDVTPTYELERRRLDELEMAKLEADRANKAKSSFLSGMSHDIRTPLNGIVGFTNFALAEEDPRRAHDYMVKVQSSAGLLLALVNDILDLSRIESGKMTVEPVITSARDVDAAVIEALRPTADAKGIKLVSGPFQDGMVYLDKLKYQKIWLNLLSNAIKYTPEGGTVEARVEVINPPIDGRNRRMIVADNGIGMTDEFQKVMFEPFSQERTSETSGIQGTGLGLSIVKRIVDLLGGTINVRSALGEGTRFEVDVKVVTLDGRADAAEAQALAVGKPEEQPVRLAGRRVLLCEDNEMNAEITVMLLSQEGVRSDWAHDGKQGAEMFAGSDPGTYDAILMDERMPVMDGREATRAIRALSRPDASAVPIIAISADAFEEDVRENYKAGMNAHVAKPIDPDELMETLRDLIGAALH